MGMTAEEWVHGLDLPNLLRYSDHATIKGFLTVAFREAIQHERDAQQEKYRKVIEEMAEERHMLHGANRDAFWGCSRGPCRVASAFLRNDQ